MQHWTKWNEHYQEQQYIIIKFELEEYLNVLEYKNAVLLCRFRTCNTKLPIETGRWLNIPRHDRAYILCNNRHIGDEYHYLLECQFVCSEEKRMFTKIFLLQDIIHWNFQNLCLPEVNRFKKKLC